MAGWRNGWLVAIASVWIMAAGAGAAVLGAWIGGVTCDDSESSLDCIGNVGGGLLLGFLLGVLGGWLTTRLAWSRLPRVLLVASALVIAGLVLVFTVIDDDSPSPAPTLQFGPGDALP